MVDQFAPRFRAQFEIFEFEIIYLESDYLDQRITLQNFAYTHTAPYHFFQIPVIGLLKHLSRL